MQHRANVCAQFALDDLERLDGLARELGITRSECLRKLVREVRVIPAQLFLTERIPYWKMR
jgi:hypothetical protein